MVLVIAPNHVLFKEFGERFVDAGGQSKCRHIRSTRDLDGCDTALPVIVYADYISSNEAVEALKLAKDKGHPVIRVATAW